MCDMTHSYMRHESFVCATWLMYMCDMTHSHVWHDSFTCVTWLIHTCGMNHSHVRHDSHICAARLIHTCDITRWYVWHGSLMCVTWRIHVCDMTHAWHLALRPQRANEQPLPNRHQTPSLAWCRARAVPCDMTIHVWETTRSYVCVTQRVMSHT